MPTVLLIEDDAEGRKRIARLFARHEWNVLEADDAVQGMEIAFAQRPEAIVCDLLLPKMSGLQVCRALREKLHATKIIVVAGRHYDVDRSATLVPGGDDYFVNPLNWEVLAKALQRHTRPPRKLTPP